jgi:hypothetical protein
MTNPLIVLYDREGVVEMEVKIPLRDVVRGS